MGSTKKSNRVRLADADIRMNRTVGAVVLLIGAVLVYVLVFTTFEQRVEFQWNVEPDGSRTPVISITCPSPWNVLVNDAEPDVVTTEGLCILPSRGLAVEGAIVTGLGLLVATYFFTRTTRPGHLPPLPIPKRRTEGADH